MTNHQPSFSPMQKGILDIKTVLRMTSERLEYNFQRLITSVGGLLFVYVILGLGYEIWATGDDLDTNQLGFGVSFFIGIILGLIWVVIAVRTHRVFIDHDASAGIHRELSGADSYLWFTIRIIWLGVLFALCASLGFGIGMLGAKVHIVIGILLGTSIIAFLLWHVSRLSLSLPSIAVKQRMSLSESYVLTEKHQFLMFIVVCVIPILMYVVPSYLFYSVVDSSLAASVFDAVLTLTFTIVEIAILSVSYVYIMQKHSSDDLSEEINRKILTGHP